MTVMPVPSLVLLNVLKASSLVPLAFLLLMIFLLMRRRPRQAASSYATTANRVQRSSRGLDAPPQHQQQVRQDVESLIVELDELARKINAQIDTRFAKLEAVIRDADRRIATLERLANQADQADQAARPRPAPTSANDAQHAVVYELADAGKTPIEIARQLGRTPGEVELILNLRGPGDPPPPPSKPAAKKRRSRKKKSNTSGNSQDG